MSLHAQVAPHQQMTWRARAWIVVLALRNLGVGGFCLFAADQFHGTTFSPIKAALPLQAWGVGMILVALNALLALIFENEWWARIAVSFSAGITFAWAAGFMVASARGMATAPIGPIVWACLATKDLIVSAMPFRSPFEYMLAARGPT